MSVNQDLEGLVGISMPFAPEDSPACITGVGKETLDWFRPFANTILSHAQDFTTDREVVLVTVCSYAKPYSHSFIHYGIDRALHEAGVLNKVEKWHLSSAGIIPACLEEVVPFCCYNWDNAEASTEDLVALREALRDYFTRWLSLYASPLKKRVVTYFREDSNTQKAIESCPGVWVRATAAPHRVVNPYRLITLDGRYMDPDCILLGSGNLSLLTRTIEEALDA